MRDSLGDRRATLICGTAHTATAVRKEPLPSAPLVQAASRVYPVLRRNLAVTNVFHPAVNGKAY